MTAATEPFVHPALFYRGIRQYLDGVVPFIREGLAAGEPVAVAVPGRNLTPIQDELGDLGGEVRFIDMEEAGRNPGRILPAVLCAFADLHPGRRVRIVGEPVWAERSESEYTACLHHEALINLAFAGRDATILCPYDVDALSAEVVEQAKTTHPVLVDASGTHASAAYAPERVIRECNRPLPDPPDAVTLAFGGGDLHRVRDFVARHAAEAGLGGNRLEDLRLIASELAANSLDYGGGSGVLRIWADGRRVALDVSDAGHITDPLAGRRPVGPRQGGSRGLLVTNLLADLVRIHTGTNGTTVRVYFDIS
ncbi:anti-sigma regulatory factor (Ser/Thr protein kinase) [Streptosporangium becharense]|uniref:Anti-sigma regulatory factor (Ser/Thr protein kinase) n=1 Tax=Streptosporangium becharense TaxID=1816182 RepID=A0A7W9IHR2_9ACTN|nr:sensor histidine kinase [Streptosporangium becharense]MBB2914676.1 anti-sigma regulatory factor (Ser/Thr protein kinase) [Streptosporangium becharense]MBB5820923.1 anti-sigma regulatory factor (Ser/Thr protein kinase) [Streptosporangium becharense]